jgi:ADP-heptose:LPS heptosyltransferase
MTADTQRFDDVLKIAVLRGGGLGDLIFTLPAIDALAEAYPEAEIVLLGTPMHRELLAGRSGPIARIEVLPRARGVFGGDDADDPRETARFFRRMAGERFDLACQLHGGGRWSNPFVQRLEARHTVGTRAADAAPLERCLPYLYYQHEVIRWLETVALAGAPSVGAEATLSVALHERLLGLELARDAGSGLAVVHPGATDPRRRWPADRFTELTARLAGDGMRVLLIGDGADAALADEIAEEGARATGGDVQSLAGRITLPELAGVLSVADVFVGNDSGPRHLAQAIGTATVGIFWFGNLINGGPLTRRRHRVQLGWTTHCPVCGADATQVGWTAERCEHDDSFVAGVPVDAVYADVRELVPATATTVRLRGT